LARKKAEGVILGRPKGRKSSHVKLKEKEIPALLNKNVSKSGIGRIMGVHVLTVTKFIEAGKCV
jgi:DNA invertase Pin-like site-specific DNA recombinase